MTRWTFIAFALLSAACKDRPASAPRVVSLRVTEAGFEPDAVHLAKGEPVILRLTRTTEHTCATELLISGTELNVPLPLGTPVDVPFTPRDAGAIRFGCAMGMMVSGVLLVE
ncbi:MAG: cupredoxin domain-containing protein [Myxococcaceae bacterium]|nr:cupredoxin domain-containing protein [Myxococcaceae bacterium]